MDEKTKKRNTSSGVLIVVVLAVIIGLSLTFCTRKSTHKETEEDRQIAAITYAEIYIKDNYYSDAEFKISEQTAVKKDGYYLVNGRFSHNGQVFFYDVNVTLLDADAYKISDCEIFN